MDEDTPRDWTWLRDPEWFIPMLLAGAVIGAFLASPIRLIIGRDATIILAGSVVAAVGWMLPDWGDPMLVVGFTAMMVGFAQFLPSLASPVRLLPPDDQAPGEIDESVAPHDIDPTTAALYDPEAFGDPAPEGDPDRFRDDSPG